jgi:hypothetical protein
MHSTGKKRNARLIIFYSNHSSYFFQTTLLNYYFSYSNHSRFGLWILFFPHKFHFFKKNKINTRLIIFKNKSIALKRIIIFQ